MLKLSFNKPPQTLDPQKSRDVISSNLIFLLFKGLMRLQANGELSYDLVDSIDISENQKIYYFHLGRHYWSDHTPITALDFVYSWKRALHPDFPLMNIAFFYPIKNARKVKNAKAKLDSVGIWAKSLKTLVVELEKPVLIF